MRERPVKSRVKHGDPTCADYGCKREECLEARRFKQKRNKLLRTTGRPGTIPPTRVAAHIARFRAAGMQDKDIITELGMARNTFYRALRGLPVTRQVEQRVLSVRPPAAAQEVSTLASVPSTGTHRRLQALLRQGWPPGVLEERLGYHQGWIVRSSRRKSVTMVTEQRVTALYDELWNVAPEAAGVDQGRARVTRRAAADQGFHGPLAWDDESIDDPTAAPATDAPAPAATEGENVADRWLMGESVVLSAEARLEALCHLFEWTDLTIAQIAARLEMTPSAAEQTWHRHRRKLRAQGEPVPWRRRWELRDKELTKNEMGEAA